MGSTINQHDIKKSERNRAHLSFDLGYQLWANSPCNQSRYDPLCLLSLPAETLMASVPTSWLSSDHIWLQPDLFWFQKTAADAWSTGLHMINSLRNYERNQNISFISSPPPLFLRKETFNNALKKYYEQHQNNSGNNLGKTRDLLHRFQNIYFCKSLELF